MNVARRWVAPTHSLLGIDLSLHQQGIETTTTGWQGHVSDDGCAAEFELRTIRCAARANKRE